MEAGRAADFKIREADGRLNPVSLRHAAGALLQAGARALVMIVLLRSACVAPKSGTPA